MMTLVHMKAQPVREATFRGWSLHAISTPRNVASRKGLALDLPNHILSLHVVLLLHCTEKII